MINIAITKEDYREVQETDMAHIRIMNESFSEVGTVGDKYIAVGMGKKKEMTKMQFIKLCRKMVSLARQHKIKKIAIDFSDFNIAALKMKDEEVLEIAATNWEMANFEFVTFKTEPDDGWHFVTDIVIHNASDKASMKNAIKKGQIIGAEVNDCRTLANTPGGSMTPEILAEEAQKAAKGTDINVRILDEEQIENLHMGAMMGVAKGSSAKPRFIIMEYLNAGPNKKPIVLVGKGITFDTGGLNLKPTTGIYEMHMDMSGGAAVIHAICAIARLGLKKNVVALIPAAENMVSGEAYRPGDILHSMSGKTIEVLNTDAEGRLVLADALHYAKTKYDPRVVIDVATLTGASLVALGQRANALFSNNDANLDKFKEWGEETGDRVWPLPLWPEYEADMKGTFADWANAGTHRFGGAIQGATFLHQFAKDVNWVHLDVAPRMTTIPEDILAKGAAGSPVQLLVRAVEKY